MVAVPAATPFTIPVPDATVAMAVLLLCQVPPVVTLLNIVVLPVHTVAVPVIALPEPCANAEIWKMRSKDIKHMILFMFYSFN